MNIKKQIVLAGLKAASQVKMCNRKENLGLKPSQLIVITSKLKPEEEENFQYILTKPIEINYLIEILHHVIRGQALCNTVANSSPKGPSARKKLNILIADDNELCRNSVVRLLEQQSSNFLTICEDGKKAFEEFKEATLLNPFDLLILDHQMPFMSGLEIIANVREYEKINNILKSVEILCIIFTNNNKISFDWR